MADASANKMRIIFDVSVIAFLLNWAWEYAQCSFFIHLAAPATHAEMLRASLGDVLLTWVPIGVLSLGTHSFCGFLERWTWSRLVSLTVINLVLAMSVERLGLSKGRWAYQSFNPTVLNLHLSVLPLLQLAILVPLTLWLAKRSRFTK